MTVQRNVTHALESSSLADILERVLDKGIVIAGDIKIKLVDIELLTIQIRLVICSVDKAAEMGMNWWVNDSYRPSQIEDDPRNREFDTMRDRLAQLEKKVEAAQAAG
ncbi:MAG: gas vesicle protein [Candidatus Sumerlaeota bacterium]|nr:gas vesicle protein [Candidatus Sumerlaeota bacterium]